MDEEGYNIAQQLEEELRRADQEKREMAKAQLKMYELDNQENSLVKWQLNLEEEKERIYHLLKGHRKIINEDGQEVWMEPESKESAILNDYGVDYIMGLLEAFMNRNIILSNFDEERIEEICMDLGNQINEDIYNDYERMGLDTDDKRKKFPIIVWKVLINVEAALRRALGGRENLNLRKIITVTQNESQPRFPEYPAMPQRKRRSLNPVSWF